MGAECERPSLLIFFLACRPKFLLASAAPVLVGSALGYAVVLAFSPLLFVLALLSIMALHAGANMANDYFDHVSGNDWANRNPTPFSGGSRYIQRGLLSPKAILLAALLALTTGSIIGLVIVLLTRSLFILILGLIGMLGGFFYTAPPLRLGYRGIGEFVIAILFGLLPVYASYYLQTGAFGALPLLPACIIGILIFLVILVNEFPDVDADAAVNKKTLVVLFGVPTSIWIYRIALVASFVIAAAAMLIYRLMFFGGLFYLFTLPLAIIAIRLVDKKDLTAPGRYRASQITVLLHSVGSLVLTAGFVLSGLRNVPA
jgi:1,4-dihydroxy-2-naphthoate octaprenyltransferase